MTATLPTKIVDSDSHIVELPDLWTSRMPSKYHDEVPRVEVQGDQSVWVVGRAAKPMHPVTTFAQAGWKEFPPSRPPTIQECDPASFYAADRLRRLDEYGIWAQVLYPNVLGFYGRLLTDAMSPDVATDVTKVYNDYLTEFCSADPDRLIAIAAMPWWDTAECVREIERTAAMGHRGILFSVDWERIGLPPIQDAHWAPVLHAAEDAGMSINLHVGFGQAQQEDMELIRSAETMADVVREAGVLYLSSSRHVARLGTCGVLAAHPNLNFVVVESGASWLPFIMEALDWNWQNFGADRVIPGRELPSFYIKRQVFGCFWFESAVALRSAVELLPDNLMFESDFPHPTSLSPGGGSIARLPIEHASDLMGVLTADQVEKVLYTNAKRLYNLS